MSILETMLGQNLTPAEYAIKTDEFKASLTKSVSNAITNEAEFLSMKATGESFSSVASKSNPVTQIEKALLNKGLSADVRASLTSALSAQRGVMADIQKDITTTTPLSSSFAAFDLEAPALLLAPYPTPLRNKLPRKQATGVAHRFKAITAFTGSGTGQPDILPLAGESVTNTFGALSLNRGPKIAYTAIDKVVNTKTFGLSDEVSWDANFSAEGFQDLRELSAVTVLRTSMLVEEKMILMARGTDAGFSGALAAPTVTLTASAATAGQTNLADATYFVYVTANAGAFGQSVLSTVASQATVSQLLNITVSAVAGAIGYNVYVGTTTGAVNAHFVGTISSKVGVLQGAASLVTTGDNLVFNTTSTLANTVVADTSANAGTYDGILSILTTVANGAVISDIESTFSTSNPGAEFQKVFASLYNSVKAQPQEILMNGSDRKQLSDAIKVGGNTGSNYRIAIEKNDLGGYTGGAMIDTLVNETVGGGNVALTVHPWLPQGVAPVLSYSLPIPDSNISDVWAVYNVQDYIGVNWPVIQQSYDVSSYWRGTFICHAPTFNGIVTGIKSA